jgi:uncharacterized membrane protein
MGRLGYSTVTGLDENVEAVLCYVGFWITGLIFLLIERENRFVQFHALQSILTFLPLSVGIYLIGWIPYVGWILADFAGFFSLLLTLVLVIMAWRGAKFRLPFSGKLAYEKIYR